MPAALGPPPPARQGFLSPSARRGLLNITPELDRCLRAISIMGREVVVALTEGRLDFGPWEQIFYGEFDGLRRKRVLVKIIGS